MGLLFKILKELAEEIEKEGQRKKAAQKELWNDMKQLVHSSRAKDAKQHKKQGSVKKANASAHNVPKAQQRRAQDSSAVSFSQSMPVSMQGSSLEKRTGKNIDGIRTASDDFGRSNRYVAMQQEKAPFDSQENDWITAQEQMKNTDSVHLSLHDDPAFQSALEQQMRGVEQRAKAHHRSISAQRSIEERALEERFRAQKQKDLLHLLKNGKPQQENQTYVRRAAGRGFVLPASAAERQKKLREAWIWKEILDPPKGQWH